MKPNFADPLNMKGDGTRVAAWGPCNWNTDPNAKRVRIDKVRITQGDNEAVSDGFDVREKGHDENWQLEAKTSSGQLHAGDANATGTATVLDPPGKPEDWGPQQLRLN
jgi:hypothetical protein